jgi:succinylarginine dihydrolase
VKWVHKHYRDRLEPDDLRDPRLLEESLSALDELTQILHLGAIFEFQQSP